jgi:hypothetical protein
VFGVLSRDRWAGTNLHRQALTLDVQLAGGGPLLRVDPSAGDHRAQQSARPRSYEGGPLAVWDQWRTFVQARPSPFFPIKHPPETKKSRVPASSLPGIGLAPIAEKIHAVRPQIGTPRRYLPSSFPACLAPHTRAYLLQDPSFAINSSSPLPLPLQPDLEGSAGASASRPHLQPPASLPFLFHSLPPAPLLRMRLAHCPFTSTEYALSLLCDRITLLLFRPPFPFYLIRIAAPGLTTLSRSSLRNRLPLFAASRSVSAACHISRTTLAIPGPRPSLDHAHLFAHCYLASISHLLFRIQSTAW